MQKLDLNYLNDIPDNESLYIYIKSLPTNTLNYFFNDSDHFFREVQILEENYHIMIVFFQQFIQKTDKNLQDKREEIEKLSSEIENLHFSLNNNNNLTQDFYEWNQKLHERTEILISRNQELETLFDKKDYSHYISLNPPPEKSYNFLAHIEENDEDFLKDFFQNEGNASFLKRFGIYCDCNGKIKRLEKEIEGNKQKIEILMFENNTLKTKNTFLEKKIDELYKELRKCQLEFKTLKEKSYLFDSFKYDFLMSSKKPIQELEIQSATKANNRKERYKRLNQKPKKYFKLLSRHSRESSHTSFTLLSDIKKTAEMKELDLREIRDFSKEIIEFRTSSIFKKSYTAQLKENNLMKLSNNSNKQKFKVIERTKLSDFIIFMSVLMIKSIKNATTVANYSKKVVFFVPKSIMFLTILYWIHLLQIFNFVYDRTLGISTILLNLRKKKII